MHAVSVSNYTLFNSQGHACAGQGLGVKPFGGIFGCPAADIPAAIGFDMGSHQLSVGTQCPSPGPARLAVTWDDEQVADSPYQELLEVHGQIKNLICHDGGWPP
jgi:hypothetical protein